MKQQTTLNWLVPLITIIAIIMAGTSIFSQGGGNSHPFITIYGDTVDIYERGIYSHDSSFVATLMKGTDVIMLLKILTMGAALIAMIIGHHSWNHHVEKYSRLKRVRQFSRITFKALRSS